MGLLRRLEVVIPQCVKPWGNDQNVFHRRNKVISQRKVLGAIQKSGT